MKYDIRRAIRTNLILIWVFAFFFPVVAMINNGLGYAMKSFLFTGAVAVIATVLFFIPIEENIKGEIMIILPLTGALLLSAKNGGIVRMFPLYMVIFGMQALYFSFKKTFIFGAGMIT